MNIIIFDIIDNQNCYPAASKTHWTRVHWEWWTWVDRIIVKSEQEAYDLYNTYSPRVGSSIHRGSQRTKYNQCGITTKRYCWSKKGIKRNVAKKNEEHVDRRSYSKRVTRVGCKVSIFNR